MKGPGWPNERGWLVIVATVLFVYILSLLAFIPRLEESQLFAALAGGVVGAILRDVFGMWTSATKAGSEIASKAMDALHQQSSPPATVTIDNTAENPVPVAPTEEPK